MIVNRAQRKRQLLARPTVGQLDRAAEPQRSVELQTLLLPMPRQIDGLPAALIELRLRPPGLLALVAGIRRKKLLLPLAVLRLEAGTCLGRILRQCFLLSIENRLEVGAARQRLARHERFNR